MRTVTRRSIRFRDGRKTFLSAVAVAAGLMIGTLSPAAAACPWIVQTHFDSEHRASDKTLVNIVFDGLSGQEHYFYGFTVTDIDLAWDLSAPSDGTMVDLGPHGRSLAVLETETGKAFELSSESIEPHTVYLVAASSPVGELEKIEAAIEPSLPFAVSYAHTRGATDVSGPLPTRSLPGIEIRSSKAPEVDRWLTELQERGLDSEPSSSDEERDLAADLPTEDGIELAMDLGDKGGIRHDVQICAYQVAMR